MRISDWSSDVCSSDLLRIGVGERPHHADAVQRAGQEIEEILASDLDALELCAPDIARARDDIGDTVDLLLRARGNHAIGDLAIISGDRDATAVPVFLVPRTEADAFLPQMIGT